MTREALLVANSVNYSDTSRSISVSEIKRTINRFAGLLAELPNPYRFHITKLFDPSPREVREKVNSLGESTAKSNSLFLYYYFGHGLLSPEWELMFLHPEGAKGSQQTLRLSTIENDLRATNARKSIFIIDCCYAGAQSRDFPISLAGEHCRLSSTTPSGRAYVQRNSIDDPIGVFTRSVMDGLTSSQACMSATDNRITFDSLFRYAYQETKRRTSHTQEPQLKGNLSEPISIYQPKPQIILGMSKGVDEKTAYFKILAICRLLSSANPPKSLDRLYQSLLAQYSTAFQTLYKLPDGSFEYRPVQENVVSRYVHLMRSLGLIYEDGLVLSAVGRKIATKWRSSYNGILLESVDKYLARHGIGRDDVEHALRQILASRGVPTKLDVLDYLSLGRALPKDELGIVLDLLGYIRAIRMSTKHAYFPW
jgi:hypothetical protein